MKVLCSMSTLLALVLGAMAAGVLVGWALAVHLLPAGADPASADRPSQTARVHRVQAIPRTEGGELSWRPTRF